MPKLTSRDYKKPQRRSLDLRRYQDFWYGAGVGVLATSLVFLYVGARQHTAPPTGATPAAHPAVLAAAAGSTPGAAGGPATFTYPEMLAKSPVVVPDKDKRARRELPAAHRAPDAPR
jgi:hypothetical protein